MPRVPFSPLVSAAQPGGSQILDRLMHATRRTFDSLDESYVALPEGEATEGWTLTTDDDGTTIWSRSVGSLSEPEKVVQELVPSLQVNLALANATSHQDIIRLDRSRHYWVTAAMTAFLVDETVAFTQTLLIRVVCDFSGVATHLAPDTVSHTYGAGFTFAATVSGSTLILTSSNASGSTEAVQVIASLSSARTRT